MTMMLITATMMNNEKWGAVLSPFSVLKNFSAR